MNETVCAPRAPRCPVCWNPGTLVTKGEQTLMASLQMCPLDGDHDPNSVVVVCKCDHCESTWVEVTVYGCECGWRGKGTMRSGRIWDVKTDRPSIWVEDTEWVERARKFIEAHGYNMSGRPEWFLQSLSLAFKQAIQPEESDKGMGLRVLDPKGRTVHRKPEESE